jgi:hypothetical protein
MSLANRNLVTIDDLSNGEMMGLFSSPMRWKPT